MNFQCRKCLKDLPLEAMSSDKRVCKQCTADRIREWRKNNPERARATGHKAWLKRRLSPQFRANRRKHYLSGKEKRHPNFNAIIRAYRKTHREEHNARAKANRAIRSGELIRPDCCGFCETTCKPHPHHWDYSLPFDVLWLCPSCHRFAHSKYPHGVKDWIASETQKPKANSFPHPA